MIKNPKLRRPIGKKKRTKGPSMYDSALFPGTPTKKGEVIPDPDLEPLEPEEDEPSETSKAIALLNSVFGSNTESPVDVSEPMQKAEPSEPDMTGKLEGKFKVSVKEMITQLNKIISAEYSEWMRWYHYALVLRGHARDTLADEFETHAEEELDHASKIALRVVALGGYPATDMVHPKTLTETDDIIKELIFREQEGIKLYRDVLALCGDNEGTRQILESNVEAEQDHVDELWRWSKNPDLMKADMSAGKDTKKPEKQAQAARSHSYARDVEGISGVSTPDLPERGRDWHGTVPGVPDEPQTVAEDEEDQEEAQAYFKKPEDILHKPLKPKEDENTKQALKALAGAPRFSRGPVIPPTAQEFLRQFGFTDEEILSGQAEMTPRMRGLYNRELLSKVRKSLNRFGS